MKSKTLSESEIANFQNAIFSWYKKNARDFPWRHTADPYEIMVSEIMLQQTQTSRVLVKYREWLKVFPTVEKLASSSFPFVLEKWQGLGYNRRAKFFFESAKIIAEKYGGIIPRDVLKLQSLKGIGAYTARAIAAFAFSSPEVFIETNIRSLFIFFFFQNRKTKIDDKEIFPLIEQTLYKKDIRTWYYALMDYGAALKTKVKNPSLQSAHYIKQSAFRGSLREARGAVIRFLSEHKNASAKKIAECEKIDYEKIERSLCDLQKENFVAEKNGVYSIREK